MSPQYVTANAHVLANMFSRCICTGTYILYMHANAYVRREGRKGCLRGMQTREREKKEKKRGRNRETKRARERDEENAPTVL